MYTSTLAEKINTHENRLFELTQINASAWRFPWGQNRQDDCIQVVLAAVDMIAAVRHSDLVNGHNVQIDTENHTVTLRKCGITDPRRTMKLSMDQMEKWPHEKENIRRWLQQQMTRCGATRSI